jgi:hypothetical protein
MKHAFIISHIDLTENQLSKGVAITRKFKFPRVHGK